MRTFLLLFLLLTSLFAQKNIEIIPANIQYTNTTLADFSEYLYEQFHNAIADYNYAQDDVDSFLYVKENATPSAIYSDRIKNFHKEIGTNAYAYIQRRGLTHLIVLDFSSQTTLNRIQQSHQACTVDIYIAYYDKNGSLKSKTLPLRYNVVYGIFSKDSLLTLQQFITNIAAY